MDEKKEVIQELPKKEEPQKEKEVIRENEFLNYCDLHKKKVILIWGDTGSGKTSLSMNIISHLKTKKPVYVYKHPNPKLIKQIGFNNMYNISELSRMANCVVAIDEPQLVFPIDDKKSNTFLMKLYTLARQKDITIVLSTSDSRWVTKGTESFVNSWFVKDGEPELLKNGSRLKTIIKNNSLFGLIDFKLNVNEFLYYDRDNPEIGGRYTFKPTKFWNDDLSNPYR